MSKIPLDIVDRMEALVHRVADATPVGAKGTHLTFLDHDEARAIVTRLTAINLGIPIV